MAKDDLTQTYKDEIAAWLESEEKDFDAGFELFVRFGHNRAVAMFLARKRKLSKLEYELQKICERPFIKEAPVMPIKPVQQVLTVAKAKANGTHEAEVKLADQGKALAVADNTINYDDLPDEMKKLYDYNRESYKKMRALHEKMKLAETDDDRAEHRSALVYLDEKVSENWKVIDDYLTGKNQEATEQQATDAAEIAKEINAARSYLSRNVRGYAKLKGDKREKMFDNLKERVDVLKKHKAEIKKETREELFKIGLFTE